MRGPQNRSTRGLVASSGLDTDEPVLNDIDTSNTVFPAKSIESIENVHGVGIFLSTLDGHLGGETGGEVDGDTVGSGGSSVDGGGQLPHVGGRGGVGVFEDASFVGSVKHVFVGGPGLGSGLGDGDVVLGGVGEEGTTAGEAVVELCIEQNGKSQDGMGSLQCVKVLCALTGDTPRSDDFDVGLEAVEGKLETDLVVTLARATVSNKAKNAMVRTVIRVPAVQKKKAHSQPSRSATAIMPRAMTGRAREVPRR